MKEIKEIIKAYNDCESAGLKTALVSVVHVLGSSYRSPGARMLIDEKGNLTGAISGGCLEGDALRKALFAISQQQTKLVTYDTSDEADAAFGVQLGCQGIIQVLFEPIKKHEHHHPISLLKQAISKRENYVLITFFNAEDKNQTAFGTRLILDENENFSGNFPIESLKEEISKDAHQCKKSKASFFKTYQFEQNSTTVFFEFIAPPISLVVIGAGNDAIPLIQMADLLGWETHVADGRNTHAKQERFIPACKVLVSKPEKILEQIRIDEQTAFVLMTHNYNYDLAMLKALLTKKVKYIGILGPKKKLDRMLEEIAVETLHATSLRAIHGPIGLDIGAETSEEIAVSIVAEIKSVFSKKKGGFLKNRNKPIHSTRVS